MGRTPKEPLDRIYAFEGGIVREVGRSSKERLGWAVKFCQENLSARTIEERRRLRLGLAIFSRILINGGLKGRRGGLEIPSEEQLESIQGQLRTMLLTAVSRQEFEFRGRQIRGFVSWDAKHERFWVVETNHPWEVLAAEHFARLLGEAGNLLRECQATSCDGQSGTCGKWFIPLRSERKHCSATCRSRESTRRSRREERARRLEESKRRRAQRRTWFQPPKANRPRTEPP